MKIRLPLSYSDERGFFVNVPTYTMIPGTFAPIVPGMVDADGVVADADPAEILALHISVECEIPDADCDGAELSLTKMQRRYKLPADYAPPSVTQPE